MNAGNFSQPSGRKIKVRSCIVGGGPAGMMLGYLLGRAGIDVVVLEKHADFFRDFRGDTVHPSTLELMYELGLIDEFLKLPHQKLQKLDGMFGGSSVRIADHSRLLRAVGLEADRRESQYLFWWGHSVLQPIYQTLLRLGLAEQSTVVMMQDATQFIYYIKGLIDAIASKDAAGIQARYHQIDSARGTNRALLLDAGQTGTDAEKVEKLTTPFTGVYDILTFMQSRVASAAEMPVSVLFGTGFHGGLSDKGEGDLRLWHAKVQGYQTREVEPALRRLYALVGEVLGVDTSDLKFAWKPLYEPTAAEFAAMYFQMAQGDNIYMTAGALRPEEVTISRFGSGKFSTETTVDVELYRASLKMAPSPTQAPPTPIAGGAPNAGPPIPPAGVSTEKPGVLGTPPGQIPAKPMPGAPAAAQAPAEKPDMNPGAKPPLAAGEVGGSNKAETEPQISDLTGRGNPNGDKTPNQLPPDASGVDPNQTPVQGQAPESEKATPEPSKGNGPKSKPDELSIEHGETKVKIKIQKPEKAK
jgi:hypothetical protein